MRIVIAGGTGFLGQALARAFARDGDQVVILSRRRSASGGQPEQIAWTPDGTAGPWQSAIDGAAAVVNLAGESIGDKRWSADQKKRILDSRVRATRSLAAAITGAAAPPPVFVSGSAVGYYGPLDDAPVTEEGKAGGDFLANVCVQWENDALRASGRTRVALLRTGLVLEKDGGALAKMLLPFKLGLGGPLGTGRQYYPWIHRDDWVRLVQWIIRTSTVEGPVNATAPTPVTNAEFTRALGRALGRPAILPAPAFALRLVLGEMADALLLSGQRAVPAKAQRQGFEFTFATIDDAFRHIFR